MNRRIINKISLFLIALAFVSLTITPALADTEYILLECTLTDAKAIKVGETYQVGDQAVPDVKYYGADLYYKFSVAKPSVVSFDVSTKSPTNPNNKTNQMQFHMLNADGEGKVETFKVNGKYSNVEYVTVSSDKLPLTYELEYKMLPGEYYIRLYHKSALNGYVLFTLKSIVPLAANLIDAEPNNNVLEANTEIALSKSYSGNIGYFSQMNEKGTRYETDESDFFKLYVPYDDFDLLLTVNRADRDRKNTIYVHLTDEDGSNYGSRISLESLPDGSVEFRGVRQGVYFVHIDAWASPARPTEYTFMVQEAASVKFPQKDVNLVVGSSVTMPVVATALGGKRMPVKWKSQNAKVASIDEKGVITAVKDGTTTITATSEDGKQSQKLTVNIVKEAVTADELVIDDPITTMAVGERAMLTATLDNRYATGNVFKWSTSDKDIVAIDGCGHLKALKAGTVEITVKAAGLSDSVKIKVE